MKLLKPALLLLVVGVCSCSGLAQNSCGVTLLAHLGGGNVCPCGSSGTYFVPLSMGDSLGIANGCGCGKYTVISGLCAGDDSPSQTVDARLFKMALPHKLLIISCNGGLSPFELPSSWLDPGESTKTGPRSSRKPTGAGE